MPSTIADEQLIAAPFIEPYSVRKLLCCGACLAKVSFWDRILTYLRGRTATVMNIRFCAAGKPPTESRGLSSIIMTGQSESFNPCAGVTAAHLHVACNCCGHSFLMATRTKVG